MTDHVSGREAKAISVGNSYELFYCLAGHIVIAHSFVLACLNKKGFDLLGRARGQ